MTSRRQYLRGVTSGGAAMLGMTAGCIGGDSNNNNNHTVGVLTMMELDVGKATKRGAELAAKQINEAGTLDGDLSVVSAGTEGKSSAAVEAHNSLVNRQEADVTLGTFAEQTAAGIMPEVANTETIHLNVGAVSPALPGKVSENYEKFKPWFRLAPVNAAFFVVDMLAFAEKFVVGEQGWTKAAILREDAAWTGQVAPALKKALPEMGIEIKDDIVFSLSESNYSPYMNKIQDMDLDCVFGLVAEAGKAPLLGYEKAGVKTPLVGDLVASQSPQYLSDIDSNSSNIIGRTFTTWGANLSSAAQEFVDMYTSEYESRPSKPTWSAFGAYAATQMYAKAKATGGDTTADVITAMEETSYTLNQKYEVYSPGETNELTGSAFPHDVKYGEGQFMPTWSQWRDGEQVTVYPEKFANAEYEVV